MCGIAGYVSFDGGAPIDRVVLERMIRTLEHRGPDDEGLWSDTTAGLASRRLAVIDLSSRGHQPMSNEDGSLHIAFNGEIYNYQELRAQLISRGHRFASDTDTETILHLYEDEGAGCLERLRGMFAFAIWDSAQQSLFVARDRLGKKPLFYVAGERFFAFASEPKALLVHPSITAQPDLGAIHEYLAYGYVPSPHSAFSRFHKLPPAHYLTVGGGRPSLHRYWSLQYSRKHSGSEQELAEQTVTMLRESVRLRMISDVPIGALLSGGIDSAAVVAMMRSLTDGPIRTFSIGFEQREYDELAYAREVARRFDTEHHEEIVRPSIIDELPRMLWHYNEPFADSSALPSLAVTRLARKHVTVALSGDGGDESFLGYERYLATHLAQGLAVVPARLRRFAGKGLALLPGGSPKSPLYRLRKLSAVLSLSPREQYARWLACVSPELQRELYTPGFAAAAGRAEDLVERFYAESDATSLVEASAHVDVRLYLPDDLLVKMDIASMANSLEVRSPFLDHHVVEFAAAVPANLKLRRGIQKYLLKRALKGIVPDAVLRRRKMGFAVPIARWLRTDLRELAYDVLLDRRARERGYFRSEIVKQYLDDHTAGRRHRHTELWALLMLELWHRMFIDRTPPATAPSTL